MAEGWYERGCGGASGLWHAALSCCFIKSGVCMAVFVRNNELRLRAAFNAFAREHIASKINSERTPRGRVGLGASKGVTLASICKAGAWKRDARKG